MGTAIVLGLLGRIIQIGTLVGAPIKRRFKYLCCFKSNITNLKNEAAELQVIERDLQAKVDAATNDVRVIAGEVETWFLNYDETTKEKDGIIREVPNVKGCCLKLGARYSLSKRAMKTTDRLNELRDQCEFSTDAISRPRPPAATEAVPFERTYEFESRKQIEEDIMATLGREDVNMIGICGMGGLGKTTMAKRIMNRALAEDVFDEIVIAVVSRPVEELNIQLEIARSLGLNLKDEGLQGRAQKLHMRLSGPKRTLIILDDVWERLKLKDLGIPSDDKGCTILFTSRNRDVLSAMNVQNIFGMEVLSKEDSWFLFKEKVGTHADDTKLNSIAREVVNECGRLPIALITVGSALKDKVKMSAWTNALRQLKRRDPDIQNFIPDVYYPLKLSYDVLDTKYKLVFLLCCLYPEDVHIPLERLTYFCMGLRIFEGGMVEERDRMHSLTDVLKDRSLLLDSEEGDDYVRMHDVVRDVCIFIAKHEGYIGDNDLTSSLQRYKLHSGFELLQIRNSTDEEIKFDGIRDLYVLSIENCSLTSLPFTQRSNNLITLVLDSCRGLKTLSVVGELVNLEILICRYCNSIEELPPEIKGLNQLKVLDLSWCGNLKRIGRGIISRLVGLEELKMLKSFDKWEGDDREEKENAGLRELEKLTKLRCLEIEIRDLALAAENIRLSSEVDIFTIKFLFQSHWLINFYKYSSNKKMCLKLDGATCLGNWIKVQLLRHTECLLLVGLSDLERIRYLELGGSESMKKVVTSSMDDGGAIVFPSFEHLKLFDMPKLEEIWDDRISSNYFQNLKILKLVDLPVLKQFRKSSQNDLGKDFLPQLEVLEINDCEMMEAVFLWKGEETNENNSCHHTTKIFPKLKELMLYYLPNLISLCQGIEGIEFPLMRKIRIRGCGKMKGMVWNENISGGSSNNASIHALFCPREVSFRCLKELDTDRNPFCSHTIHVSIFNGLEMLNISDCVGSLSLFTSSIARNLVNLQKLNISFCKEMVEVIKDEEGKGMSGGQTALLFPKLQTIKLWDLPNLLSFCESKVIESTQFPILREMIIKGCKKMKGMVVNGLTSNDNNSEGSNSKAHTHLFCESQQVSFGCLKRLTTEWNPFCSHTIDVSIFNGLEELKISTCAGSLSIFTSSMAGNLVNLKVLSIGYCEEMVEVIKDEEEKSMSSGQRALLFPKLQTIKLSVLPKLVSFCESKGIESIQFPVLRSVKIKRCENMEGMVANRLTSNENSEGINNNVHTHLFCESQQVSLGWLKELRTDQNPFCSHAIHVSLFNGLEKLEISRCPGSVSLFTSSMARNLVNLKELSISECDEMVEVIKDDEDKGMGGAQRALLFPKLHVLWLSYLPNLLSFCKSKGIESIQFPVLRRMDIWRCGKMKGMVANGLTSNENYSGGSSSNAADTIHLFCESQLVSFGCLKKLDTDHNSFSELEKLEISRCHGILSLFTSSMAGNLVNLQVLRIEGCDEMVEVIKDDEEKGMSGGHQTALLFPKLHTLYLLDLPNLLSFCKSKGIESIQFPVLRSMTIKGCGKMKGMVANGLTSNDNNFGGSNNNAHTHLFCESQHVSSGCLEKLWTERNPFCSHTIHVSLFNGLEELGISNCVGSLSLFTSSMARNLVNLKELYISECDEMVEVIRDDEEKGMSGDQRALLFPKLHMLRLRNLRKLVSFCELKCNVEFSSLAKVEIDGCPDMKNFTLGSLAAPNLKSFKTDLKDYLLQVPFNSSKKICVQLNEKPMKCYQIHGSVFDRLEVLKIEWYKGTMSLFSPSIIGNLVNLTKLTIKWCENMVTVIEDREEEKEKVMSGGQRTLLFPKLQRLQLLNAHKLVRFCEWKCDVELPSLRGVEIYGCHNMKSFTLGPLNTPKLESVRINNGDVGGVKDLNGLVQQQYLSRAEEEEKKKKMKDGQE